MRVREELGTTLTWSRAMDSIRLDEKSRNAAEVTRIAGDHWFAVRQRYRANHQIESADRLANPTEVGGNSPEMAGSGFIEIEDLNIDECIGDQLMLTNGVYA